MNNSQHLRKISRLKTRQLYLRKEKLKAKARESLLGFTLYTKPDYQVNWHHRLLCDRLDNFIKTPNARMIIQMPPRVGKSELVSRRLPAYLLGLDPQHSIVGCSYSADLATRINRDVQRIIDTDPYRSIFPETTLSGENVSSKVTGSWLRNNDVFEVVGSGGVYRATGIGGGITGMGFNTVIIDDPIKSQKEADSPTIRNSIFHWYQSVVYTRLEKNSRILITLTRWHEDDLAGRLLDLANHDDEADKWEVISFPMLKDGEAETNEDDPREIGEPLWPDKFDLERCRKIKPSVGTRSWNAMYQQRPTAQEGGIIKRSWFVYWRELPDTFDEVIDSWDLSFKDTDGSDYCVGQKWGRVGARFYLIAQFRDRMDFPTARKSVQTLNEKAPKPLAILIEDAANGPAVISSLKEVVPGIVPWKPTGSKEARMHSVSALFEAGNVYLPDPSIAPWIGDYIEELVNFPRFKNDDQCDATSQALIRLHQQQSGSFTKSMAEGRINTMSPSKRGRDLW